MWHEHPDLPSCIDALAGEIAQGIQHAQAAARPFTLAVSGGRSPIPLFERLAQLNLDWSHVRIRLVDERYVPPDHADSNESLVRRHLLSGPPAKADFRGLYLVDADINAAVTAANADFQTPDVALLGMGEDGHMASIFPGASQFEAAVHPEAAPYLHVSPPQAPHQRISMSLAALRQCKHRVLYISGTSKRNVLQEAQRAATARLPISLLVTEPGDSLDVHWHP